MKRIVLCSVLVGVCVFVTLYGQSQTVTDTPQFKKIATFMRPKLVHSQKVLEGLVIRDFNMIRKNGQDMGLLSLDSNWQVIQSEEYLIRSREFQRTTQKLVTMADEQNLDGAALAYIQMTTQCFDCHKYVRDKKGNPLKLRKTPKRNVPIRLRNK